MKTPSRIVVPIILATAFAGVLMGFLWLQLTQSTRLLHGQSFDDTQLLGAPTNILSDEPIDTGDISLVHLRQGDLLALRGEWAEAEKEYRAAVDTGGGLPALRKLAQAELQRRDIKGVRSTLKKMKANKARPEDILLLEVIIQLRSGELVDAKKELESAEESPQQHYGLALLAIVQGAHQSAIKELQLVIEGWDPVLRSYARTLQSAYDEFALFPEGSDMHLVTLLSRALAQVQECELTIPLLVQITNQKDDYRDAWIVQGYCELVTERPEQALASLEQAYSLDPQKPEIQYFLARSYADLHEYQNAITFLEYALSNGFQPHTEIRRLIAKNALEIGNASLALDQYDALTVDQNATYEAYEGYVTAAAALGQPEQALVKANEAIARWPKDARAYDLLAAVAIQLERNDEARSAIQKALKLNPNLESAKRRMESL
ncbi:MAG: tetratricopeptide repeat protein [Candidatus Peribacteraceae bacterium]|nr:tetratricopeptide repeat protein [Candidatus Peribacteraceae bacterium]